MMISSPTASGEGECPARDEERLALIHRLDIAGTPPESTFDMIASLAADLFHTPIAALTIVDETRLWLKAAVGLETREIPVCDSFCRFTIKAPEVMVVLDATKDLRFQDNPLVTGESHVRFYAGAPLRSSQGVQIGALCILDTEPRDRFSGRQASRLAAMAEIAMGEIERRHVRAVAFAARGFADASADVHVCTRDDGTITYINKAAEQLFGYDPAEMVGRDIAMIIPRRFVAGHRIGMARVAAGGKIKRDGRAFEVVAVRKDGSEFPAELSLNVWRDEYGGSNMGATMRDITARKEDEQRLSQLALFDPLTGFARPNTFQQDLAKVLAEGLGAAVLMMQIDGLRGVNDSLGHAAGDALLQAISIRLSGNLPTDTTLARWGGDTFAALLPGLQEPAKATEVAYDAQLALSEPFLIGDNTMVVGATVGAALAPDHASEPRELVAAADLALQDARTARGQRFRLFEQSMRTASVTRRALRDEIRQGLAADRFVLHYQPQVSLVTGEVVGAEALMRWRHPVRGLLHPAAFISAIEESTLALQAGWWSLDQACRQISQWRAERCPNLRVSVNLFAAQLHYGGLVSTVRDRLEAHGVPGESLDLEVRETIADQDNETVIAVLRGLRDLGVGIALDDFGTGYASLLTLKKMPVTVIKIDQGFVRDIGSDRHNTAIASAVLDVGRSFGVAVIAEGIETPRQEKVLRDLGCTIGQGYLYGKAVGGRAFHGARRHHVPA